MRIPRPARVLLAVAIAVTGGLLALRWTLAILLFAVWDIDGPEFKAAQRQAERLPAALAAVRDGRASAASLQGEFQELILRSQADRNWNHPREALWRPEFGETIERLHQAGVLPADRWATYAANAVDFRLEKPDRVPQGEPIVCRLTMIDRVGPDARFRVAYRASFLLDDAVVIDAPLAFADSDVSPAGGQTPWFGLTIPSAVAATLADGPHSLTGTVDSDVYDTAAPGVAPVGHRQVLLFDSYMQTPAGSAAPAPGFDAVARADLGRHVRVASLVRGLADDTVNIDLETRGLTDGYACSVWLRRRGQEWLIAGNLELSPARGVMIGGNGPPGRGEDAVEVILRPAGAAPLAAMSPETGVVLSGHVNPTTKRATPQVIGRPPLPADGVGR